MRGPPEERTPAELLRFGVVNLDKPPGPSAHEVTEWVRDLCSDALEGGELVDTANGSDPEDARGEEPLGRAAHAGTLDPKVTGCLPILLGDATRLAPVFLEGAKEYVAVLELHEEPPPDLEATVAEFERPLYQKPPRKSAVVRELRVREVYDLDVLEVGDRQALLRIRCESGTYVRKLCHDLGLALGTGAHMGHLRRAGTDPFDDRDLSTLHDLADALSFEAEDVEDPPADLREVVEPAERALSHLPAVTIAPSAAKQVAHGAPVYAPCVLEVDDVVARSGATDSDQGANESDHDGGATDDADDPPLVACFTPDGAAVCLGRLVGDPDADEGTVVDLERVLV